LKGGKLISAVCIVREASINSFLHKRREYGSAHFSHIRVLIYKFST